MVKKHIRGRPRKKRVIEGCPKVDRFIPADGVCCEQKPVEISLEEYEALRLVDYEGLTQEDAGGRIGVSRGSVQRSVSEARKKMAAILVEGRPLLIISDELMEGCNQQSRTGPLNLDVLEDDSAPLMYITSDNPKMLDYMDGLRRALMTDGAMPCKCKYYAMITAATAVKSEACLEEIIVESIEVGTSHEEILEAISLAHILAGRPALAIAQKVLKRLGVIA